MPFCSNCGKEYTYGSKFCSNCEAKLEDITTASANPQPQMGTAEEVTIWEGKPAGLTARLKDKVNLNSTTYILTNQRIIVKSGLIGKKQEEIELYRVKDIQVKQSLKDRALGVGEIKIISTDSTASVLELEDVKNPVEVKEMIRKAVRAEKERHGIKYQERL